MIRALFLKIFKYKKSRDIYYDFAVIIFGLINIYSALRNTNYLIVSFVIICIFVIIYRIIFNKWKIYEWLF